MYVVDLGGVVGEMALPDWIGGNVGFSEREVARMK